MLLRTQLRDHLQASDDFRRTRWTRQRILAQQRQNEGVHGDRHVRRILGGRNDRRLPELPQARDVASRVDVFACQHVVGKGAKGVQVGALVEGGATERLGCDHGRCPDDLARRAKVCQGTKVEQLAVPVGSQTNVPRAQIPMQNLPPVQQGERRRHVAQIGACAPPAERSKGAQILARQQLHRIVGAVDVDPVVQHPNNARMLQTRQHLVLALQRLR